MDLYNRFIFAEIYINKFKKRYYLFTFKVTFDIKNKTKW